MERQQAPVALLLPRHCLAKDAHDQMASAGMSSLPGARVTDPPVSPCLLAPPVWTVSASDSYQPLISHLGAPPALHFPKPLLCLKLVTSTSHLLALPPPPCHLFLECNSLLSVTLPDPGQMLAALLASSRGTAMPPPPLLEVAQHITLQCFPYVPRSLFLWASLSAELHGTRILFSTAQENVDVL